METTYNFLEVVSVDANNDESSSNSHTSASSNAAFRSVGQPRWYCGCREKYSYGACTRPTCDLLHDLNEEEIKHFRSWQTQGGHVVFDSSNASNSSGRESIMSDQPRPSKQASSSKVQYNQLVKVVRQQFRGMDDTEVATKLPVMQSGMPSSMGSVLHATDQCRPCRNMLTSGTCKDGIRCLYCHLDHTLPRQVMESLRAQNSEVNSTRRRDRPTRSDKEVYNNTVREFEEQILQDPSSFDVEAVVVPDFISASPELTMKFLKRLQKFASGARNSSESQKLATGARSSSDLPSASTNMTPGAQDTGDAARRRRRNLISL